MFRFKSMGEINNILRNKLFVNDVNSTTSGWIMALNFTELSNLFPGNYFGSADGSENFVRLGDLKYGDGWPGPIYRRRGGSIFTLQTNGEHTPLDDNLEMHGNSTRYDPDELVALVTLGNGYKKRYWWREFTNWLLK